MTAQISTLSGTRKESVAPVHRTIVRVKVQRTRLSPVLLRAPSTSRGQIGRWNIDHKTMLGQVELHPIR